MAAFDDTNDVVVYRFDGLVAIKLEDWNVVSFAAISSTGYVSSWNAL